MAISDDLRNRLNIALGSESAGEEAANIITLVSAGAALAGVANTFTVGPQTILTGADGNRGVVVKANSATQSVPLQEWQKSTGVVLFSVGLDVSGNPVLTTGVLNANFFLQGDGSQNLAIRQWALINLQSSVSFSADLTTWNAGAVHYARLTVPSGLGAGLDYLQAHTAGGAASTGGIHLSGSGHAVAFGGASGSPDTLLWRNAQGAIYTDSSYTRTGLSSTAAVREQATLDTAWVDSTDATRKARLLLQAWDTAAREVMRGEATGSAAAVGFLGATAVARQAVTGSRGGNAALASLLTALAALGLITDSSSA